MDDLLRRQIASLKEGMDKIVKEGYDRFTYAAVRVTPTMYKFRYMPFRGQNVGDSKHVRLTEIQNTAVDTISDAKEVGVPYTLEVDSTKLSASSDLPIVDKLYQVCFHYTVENGKRNYKLTDPAVIEEIEM